MILVDTSVWIDHLRGREPMLKKLLESRMVLAHPYVIGELACGNLKRRTEILSLLQALPAARAATDAETLKYIDKHDLMGRGIGYIDAHLLAATVLTDVARLWTRDKRLHEVAQSLGYAWSEVYDS